MSRIKNRRSGKFMRVCPNPDGNPRCKKVVPHLYRREMEAAVAEGKKCSSCSRYGLTGNRLPIEKSLLGAKCKCGCGKRVRKGRVFVTGHNGLVIKKRNREDPNFLTRTCPNPKDNPNCRKLLRYSSRGEKTGAERQGCVCWSCAQRGKVISEDSREQIAKTLTGHVRSEASKKKQSASSMGRVVSEATRRKISATRSTPEYKAKMSAKFSGAGNPMYGKPSPKGASSGISGWLNGFHFRSSCELRFLLDNKTTAWISAESEKFRIVYKNVDGKKKHYFPDLFHDGKLVEVKATGWQKHPSQSINVDNKRVAAEKFCAKRGWEYVFAEVPHIPKEQVFAMRQRGVVELNSRWERKYQNWMNRRSQRA